MTFSNKNCVRYDRGCGHFDLINEKLKDINIHSVALFKRNDYHMSRGINLYNTFQCLSCVSL